VSIRLSIVGVMAITIAMATACKRRANAHDQQSVASVEQTLRAKPPDVRDGDLIFQESTSGQSEMVRALTRSRWTHMGVIAKTPTGMFVLEAASPVRMTSLARWIAHGRDGRYVVKRLRDADLKLTPDVVTKMTKLGATWQGRPYDLRFRWDDQALYCSELAYKLYERATGIRIGTLQRASDMNLDDERVQRAIRKRFANATFDPAELVITPDSMFNDEQLVEVKP
jgi:hypothetical protein